MREFFLFSPVTVVVVVVGLARILAGGRTAIPQPPKVCYVTERSIAEKKKKERKKKNQKEKEQEKQSPKTLARKVEVNFRTKNAPKKMTVPRPIRGVVFVLKYFSK